MHRTRTLAVGLGVAVAALIGISTVATTAGGRPEPQPYGPPIGPVMPEDTGAGEQLILVVGGVYPSRADAEAGNAAMVFGDLQGYYVVPVAQFQGFREQIGGAGDFALVSAFRTQEGADAFVELASAFDVPAVVYPRRVTSLGGLYAGLGQESAPDGTGPLLGPVPQSLP
jgi:hypothetical protein